ncbi:HAD family hydrolase [Microvirga yunnanensis]|uniref:HAD family hydrolase n=1 Tax=Microvirga yunnanensis TaxID=2953740 RepID=UPI0021C7418F|nr:HAD family hydrolase [Microvirga sp. HBU65207]
MIALFDLDGTLTDPKAGITRSVQYALERLGRPVPDAGALTWMIGPPLVSGFTELLGGAEEVPDAVRFYRERYGDVGLFENEVYAGIPALLRSLEEKGVRLHVATSKLQVFAQRILEHFDLSRFFAGIYGSEPDNRNADKRDLIRHILDRERFDPAGAVMIGDRKHDVIGAAANGIATIGVSWGYGFREELRQAGAACLADDPQGLEAAILRLTGSTPRPAATA